MAEESWVARISVDPSQALKEFKKAAGEMKKALNEALSPPEQRWMSKFRGDVEKAFSDVQRLAKQMEMVSKKIADPSITGRQLGGYKSRAQQLQKELSAAEGVLQKYGREIAAITQKREYQIEEIEQEGQKKAAAAVRKAFDRRIALAENYARRLVAIEGRIAAERGEADPFRRQVGMVRLERDRQAILNELARTAAGRDVTARLGRMGIDLTPGRLQAARNELAKIQSGTRDILRGFGLFPESITKIIQKVNQWVFAMGLVYGSLRAIQNAFRTIAETQFARIGLEKVLRPEVVGDVAKAGKELQVSAAQLAKDFGANTKDVLEAMTEWARQGKNIYEITELTRVALLAQNIAELSVKDATKLMTAAMQEFNLSSGEAITLLDRWNELSNTTSATTGDIAEAVRRFGNIAQQTGTNIVVANSLAATVLENTKDTAERVGTAFRTMYARMVSKDTISTFQKEFKQLNLEIAKGDGTLMNSAEVLQRLAQEWGGFSEQQKNRISQIFGERRQVEFLLSALNNWEEVVENVLTQYRATGSAVRENQRFMASWIKQIDIARATLQEMIINLDDTVGITEVGNNAIQLFTGSISGLSTTLNLILSPLKKVNELLGGISDSSEDTAANVGRLGAIVSGGLMGALGTLGLGSIIGRGLGAGGLGGALARFGAASRFSSVAGIIVTAISAITSAFLAARESALRFDLSRIEAELRKLRSTAFTTANGLKIVAGQLELASGKATSASTQFRRLAAAMGEAGKEDVTEFLFDMPQALESASFVFSMYASNMKNMATGTDEFAGAAGRAKEAVDLFRPSLGLVDDIFQGLDLSADNIIGSLDTLVDRLKLAGTRVDELVGKQAQLILTTIQQRIVELQAQATSAVEETLIDTSAAAYEIARKRRVEYAEQVRRSRAALGPMALPSPWEIPPLESFLPKITRQTLKANKDILEKMEELRAQEQQIRDAYKEYLKRQAQQGTGEGVLTPEPKTKHTKPADRQSIRDFVTSQPLNAEFLRIYNEELAVETEKLLQQLAARRKEIDQYKIIMGASGKMDQEILDAYDQQLEDGVEFSDAVKQQYEKFRGMVENFKNLSERQAPIRILGAENEELTLWPTTMPTFTPGMSPSEIAAASAESGSYLAAVERAVKNTEQRMEKVAKAQEDAKKAHEDILKAVEDAAKVRTETQYAVYDSIAKEREAMRRQNDELRSLSKEMQDFLDSKEYQKDIVKAISNETQQLKEYTIEAALGESEIADVYKKQADQVEKQQRQIRESITKIQQGAREKIGLGGILFPFTSPIFLPIPSTEENPAIKSLRQEQEKLDEHIDALQELKKTYFMLPTDVPNAVFQGIDEDITAAQAEWDRLQSQIDNITKVSIRNVIQSLELNGKEIEKLLQINQQLSRKLTTTPSMVSLAQQIARLLVGVGEVEEGDIWASAAKIRTQLSVIRQLIEMWSTFMPEATLFLKQIDVLERGVFRKTAEILEQRNEREKTARRQYVEDASKAWKDETEQWEKERVAGEKRLDDRRSLSRDFERLLQEEQAPRHGLPLTLAQAFSERAGQVQAGGIGVLGISPITSALYEQRREIEAQIQSWEQLKERTKEALEEAKTPDERQGLYGKLYQIGYKLAELERRLTTIKELSSFFDTGALSNILKQIVPLSLENLAATEEITWRGMGQLAELILGMPMEEARSQIEQMFDALVLEVNKQSQDLRQEALRGFWGGEGLFTQQMMDAAAATEGPIFKLSLQIKDFLTNSMADWSAFGEITTRTLRNFTQELYSTTLGAAPLLNQISRELGRFLNKFNKDVEDAFGPGGRGRIPANLRNLGLAGLMMGSAIGQGLGQPRTFGKSLGLAATGASIGSLFGPVGTAIGAGVGLLGSIFRTNKKIEDNTRETARLLKPPDVRFGAPAFLPAGAYAGGGLTIGTLNITVPEGRGAVKDQVMAGLSQAALSFQADRVRG